MYLIKGRDDGWSGTKYLSDVPDYMLGEADNAWMGNAVSKAGDFNYDGAGDFLVSASFIDEGVENNGKVYLKLGDKIFCRITGTIQYYSGIPAPNITLRVNGDPTTYTGESGFYTMDLLPE